MRDPSAAMRKAASQALAKTFKEHLRTFALITNVLAKDKEISDRWRGFGDIADARHLAKSRRTRSSGGAGRSGTRGLSAPLASLLRAQGALVRQEAAAALGPQRAAAGGPNPHHRLERGAGDRALRLWPVFTCNGGDRGALLSER